ncbi:hypothetical protein GCM10017706_33650 [Lactococcus lactis subsp. hordniae]
MLFATNHALGLTTPDGRDTAADGTIYAAETMKIIVFVLLIRMGQWKLSIHGPRLWHVQ